MKNYRATQLSKPLNPDKYNRYVPPERKPHSPHSPSPQNRLTEYEQLAKKAKEQLKEFEQKRKISPENARPSVEERKDERTRPTNPPAQTRTGAEFRPGLTKNLQHTYSQKILVRENANSNQKQEKGRAGYYEGRAQKYSAEAKVESPRKKHYIDSGQYKKLHEKLDLIENKITDMKKNLQKKKEQKQKNLESKQKVQLEQKKNGLRDLVTKVPQHTDLHTFNSNPYSPRHNVYYVSQLVRAYKDEQSLARQHLVNSLNILKMLEKSKKPTDEQARKTAVHLPRRKGYEDKKTVVFDLDETLIHCNDTLNPPFDLKLPIKFPTGEVIEAGINVRPYSRQILKNLSKHFQVIVFTASHSCYANVVIDELDPTNEYVHHRLFREHCFLSPEGMYVKDLRVLGRDLRSLVLVDNAAYSYAYQLSNGIPIFPYYHGKVDFQLKMLEDYLMRMAFCKDVRQINDNTFKLGQYKNYYTRPEKLVEDLYINQ